MTNALSILPFGTQYYRPNTPRPDSWESDIANIRRHGFNTVKLMIPWRWCNPARDKYVFDDFDRLMELCRQNQLHVVLNPVYNAPAWVLQDYPDCLTVTADDRKIYTTGGAGCSFGTGFYCYHHPEVTKLRVQFLTKLVRHYASHPSLLCWDVANEPELVQDGSCRQEKPENLACYCEHSVALFRRWLQDKYGSIEKLNELWVRNYLSFDDVEVPRGTYAYTDMIDWRLFAVDTVTNECHLRIHTAKAADPHHPVMVHTVTMPIFPLATSCSNDYAIATECDLFGNSLGSEPLSAAITLSAAPDKMVINSEIHAVGGSTYDRPKLNDMEDMKRHIFAPLSAGIKGFLFWQYRPERLGLESPAWGLTDLAGGDTPWLLATEKIAAAVQENAQVILGAQRHPEVGVLNSQRGQLFDFCVRPGAQWYVSSVKGAHAMLRAAGYAVDVVGDLQMTSAFLSRYKVLYDPFPYYKDGETCRILREWVAAGGTLIAECCFGGYSYDDGLHSITMPGFGFEDVFGANELRVTTAASFNNAYDWAATGDKNLVPVQKDGKTYQGFHFYQAIQPKSAQVLASFADGSAAIVANNYGKGKAVWIGSLLACAYEKGCKENTDLLADLVHSCSDTLPELITDRLNTVASALCSNVGQMVVVDNRSASDNVTVQAKRISLSGSVLVNIITGEETPIQTVDGYPTVQLPVKAGCIDAYRVK